MAWRGLKGSFGVPEAFLSLPANGVAPSCVPRAAKMQPGVPKSRIQSCIKSTCVSSFGNWRVCFVFFKGAGARAPVAQQPAPFRGLTAVILHMLPDVAGLPSAPGSTANDYGS